MRQWYGSFKGRMPSGPAHPLLVYAVIVLLPVFAIIQADIHRDTLNRLHILMDEPAMAGQLSGP